MGFSISNPDRGSGGSSEPNSRCSPTPAEPRPKCSCSKARSKPRPRRRTINAHRASRKRIPAFRHHRRLRRARQRAEIRGVHQPRQLEHYVSQAGYAHWSFDETTEISSKPRPSAFRLTRPICIWKAFPNPTLSPAHARGRWNGACVLTAAFMPRQPFPGISDNVPHTVSFWVKVPKDANISNAYAMVAWGVNNKKLGSHPIHIVWNRNASEGTIGVLRTDYGGGYALGATPLRDGRWHHIAVVFIPRDDPQRPIEVNQYVDGRLEGEGKSSTPGSDVFMYSNKSAPTTTEPSGSVAALAPEGHVGTIQRRDGRAFHRRPCA